VWHLELAPDGALWITTFDLTFPYPGGLTRRDELGWKTWSAGSSPLLHNQIDVIDSRSTGDSHQIWVGFASEGFAVIDVE
jgi:hypothetical protein